MVAQIHCKLFASFICTICPSKFLPPSLKLFLSLYLSPSLSIIGWGKIHLLEVFSFAPGLNGVLYGSLDLTVYIIVAHLEPEICITSSPPLCLCSPAKAASCVQFLTGSQPWQHNTHTADKLELYLLHHGILHILPVAPFFLQANYFVSKWELMTI